MINHVFAREIKTGRELEKYFSENLEVGDSIRTGGAGRNYIIIACSGGYYWAQYEDEKPMTLTVHDMDSIK